MPATRSSSSITTGWRPPSVRPSAFPSIPRGSAAAFILLEHLWAVGLKKALQNSNGVVIAHGWVTPATLIAMGEAAAAEAEDGDD